MISCRSVPNVDGRFVNCKDIFVDIFRDLENIQRSLLFPGTCWWSFHFVFLFFILGEKIKICENWEKNICHIYSSHHLPTYLHANLCPCRTLFSEVEVVLVRSSLTQTHSRWVTVSPFLFLQVSLQSRCQALTILAVEKQKSQTEWRDEMHAVATCSNTVRPPSSRPGCWEVRQAAGWLSTQTLQRQRSLRSL